jgi:hypothetical protein
MQGSANHACSERQGIEVQGMNDTATANLTAIKQQRLQILQEQHALVGLLAPPHIVIEIRQLEAELRELTAQRQRNIVRDQVLATDLPDPAPGLLLLIAPGPLFDDPLAQSANDAIDFHRTQLRHCWLIASSGERGSLARAYELRDYYASRRIQMHIWQVHDAASIQETYALIDWLYRYHIPEQGLADEDVIADITGATKPMTIGMVLACGARRKMQYMIRQAQGPSLPLLLELTLPDEPLADPRSNQ